MLTKYFRSGNPSDPNDTSFSFDTTDVYLIDATRPSVHLDAQAAPNLDQLSSAPASSLPWDALSDPSPSVDKITIVNPVPHVVGGLTINLIADASVASASSGFAAAI